MGYATRRPTVFAFLLATTAWLPVVPAHADDGHQSREATITVSGSGESRATPDMAVISLTVSKQEKTARESLDANNQAMTAVLDALKADGIEPRDLQTSGFTIQPIYTYPQGEDGSPKPPELVGYQTSNALTIRLRDVSKAGAVIDRSVTLGINQGGDISFVNEDTKKIMAEARAEALADAMEKARQLTEGAGVRLGRVLNISESSGPQVPVPMLAARMEKDAAPAAVPMAPGENSYSVTVNITFEIRQ